MYVLADSYLVIAAFTATNFIKQKDFETVIWPRLSHVQIGGRQDKAETKPDGLEEEEELVIKLVLRCVGNRGPAKQSGFCWGRSLILFN